MAIIRRASGFDICPLAFRGAEFRANVTYLAYSVHPNYLLALDIFDCWKNS